MIAALAILTFLVLAAAGIIWAVRRDDRQRASRRAAAPADAGSPVLDSTAYAAASISDANCGGGSVGGDCGGGD